MNRFINALLLFLFLPTLFCAIAVGFDFPFTKLKFSGASMPYKEEVFLGIGLIFLVLILRRSIRRWMGMRIVRNVSKFKWNQEVSSERRRRVVVYSCLEGVILGCAGLGLYLITPIAWAPALALFLGMVDNFIFTFMGIRSHGFRVGLSSKALIVADREISVLYFTGLRKVSIHQQTVFFDYIKDLQLTFPLDCIAIEKKADFFKQLEDQVDRSKVFFSRVR